MPIYLYVKTHNKTGLKYLGKTTQNPFKYVGSGTRWKNHLKKHGNDISTEVLCESQDHQCIKEQGIYYSELWDVVKSNEWANLKIEEGDGGFSHLNTRDSEHKLRCKAALKKAVIAMLAKRKIKPWSWSSLTAKQSSIKANIKLNQLRASDPERFAKIHQDISERYQGEGNHNYGKVWCVCLDDPKNKVKRIMCHPENIPVGYMAVAAYKDSLKNKSSALYGKIWIHNPSLEQNKLIDPIDNLPDGWYNGRRMKYYQKKC